ncbi:MAG: sigma-54-dependent Fis family transcriptional regulator [Candidatus Hydrogenedentota bacterium]|nr:MAG: sigma-54-dependent Fis family transcriptional regulator [Candidatus Hydrogenedentota bacterium]
MAEVLVVDDDTASRDVIVEALEREGHKVAGAKSGAEALENIKARNYDLIVTDLVMPNIDGFRILDEARSLDPAPEVVILTGYGSVESAVDAMKRGAFQYLNKPVNIAELREVCRKALERHQLARDNLQLRRTVDERFGFEQIIGNSPPMLKLFQTIRQVAPTSANVLITGPSGTGKELIAHAIHNNSPRKKKPFLAFNCGALTESLIESELFGHERGAFTGAVGDRKGYFELADGGTLLLDEIGDMPLHTQVKLLRVLETQSFFRVGGVRKIEVDVRVLAATNADLESLIAENRFRQDLYFRLKVLTLDVPPLSARSSDIPLLLNHFLEQFGERHGKPGLTIESEAVRALVNYSWPGNVRELKNLVENLVITATSSRITLQDLPPTISGRDAVSSSGRFYFEDGMTMEEIEREAIRIALERTGGNKKRAAERLGMSLRTFHRKVKNLAGTEKK